MPKQAVQIYSTVTVKSNHWQRKYTIVRPEEVDIFENKISIQSPLGEAILNHKVNDIIEVKTPERIIKYKIIAVE